MPSELQPVLPATNRPYGWGRFQGWLLVVGATILLLIYLSVVFLPAATAYRFSIIEGIVLSLMTLPMGLGILKKRLYGLVLVDVMTVFFFLTFAFSLVRPSETTVSTLLSLLIWVACSVYYHKRRPEFR